VKMKVSDFKLLSTLPEEYDYELFKLNNETMAFGTLHQTVIGFVIRDNRLISVNFSVGPTPRSLEK